MLVMFELSSNVTVFNAVQLENKLLFMLVTLFGMVMLVNEVQSINAAPPMLITPFGMIMLVNEVLDPNAAVPMLVTVEGMFILCRPETANNPSPIDCNPLKMTTFFVFESNFVTPASTSTKQ